MIRTGGLVSSVLVLLAAAAPAAAQCPGAGDCCVANGTPSCNDEACCEKVCRTDPFCCSFNWDSICAAMAADSCPACGAGCPGEGSCCTANGTPGCDNDFCCSLVCTGDEFCCTTEWDASCAAQAAGLCTACQTGCPGGGDCCANNGTPGCEDEACCELVCDIDPFCCTGIWDALCADRAADVCIPFESVLADAATAPAEALPGQTLTLVYEVLNTGTCPFDAELAAFITPVSAPGAPVSSPECDVIVQIVPERAASFSRCFNLPTDLAPGFYEVCYELRSADGQTVLDDLCREDLVVLDPGDVDGDGYVGIGDFLMVLGLWGPCPDPCPPGCPCDIDADCAVGIADFLIVIGNWD